MNEESWDKTKRMFPVGSAVDVLVTTEMPFGLLVGDLWRRRWYFGVYSDGESRVPHS